MADIWVARFLYLFCYAAGCDVLMAVWILLLMYRIDKLEAAVSQSGDGKKGE